MAACRLCVCRSEPVSVSVSSCVCPPASFCMALSGFSNLSCLLSICLFSSLHFHFSPCSHPHSRSSRYVRNRIQSFIQQVMSLLPLIPIRLSTPIFADFKFPFPSALVFFSMQPPIHLTLTINIHFLDQLIKNMRDFIEQILEKPMLAKVRLP